MKLILYLAFLFEALLAVVVASAFPIIAEAQLVLAFVIWLCLSKLTYEHWGYAHV